MPDKTKLDSELTSLNAEVDAALNKRRQWMDAHMADYARFPIGTEIYDMNTGERLGVVTRLYRYWTGHNDTFDHLMDVNYEYHKGNNIYDNTSRQYLWIGTREDLARHLQSKAEWLALKNDPEAWQKLFDDTFSGDR